MTGAAPLRALVVIDMQRAFGPGTEWATPGFDDLCSLISDLVTQFPGRTVFTRYLPPQPVTGSWVPYFDRYPTMLRDATDPLWDLVVAPPGGSPVLDSHCFGKWGPDLREAVQPDATLCLAGVATECCVLATALAAADAARTVWIIEDACRGSSTSMHQQALRVLQGFSPQIRIVTAAEAIAGVTGSR